MTNKIELKGCPCCGGKAFWRKGNKETRMPDAVQCLNCGLEVEETYTPCSALSIWNKRVSDQYIININVDLDGNHYG